MTRQAGDTLAHARMNPVSMAIAPGRLICLQVDAIMGILAAARAYLPTLPAKQESLFDLAITSIQERVRTLGGLVGIHGLSPHDCRHSWATRAASHGTPLDRLKQAGGWSNLQTPLRYIKESAIANEGVILE